MAIDGRRLRADDERPIEATSLRAAGLSYDAIGRRLGVRGSTVHRWLNGETPARRAQVRRAVAKTVQQRRALGLCIACGNAADATASYCSEHAEADRARKRVRHQRLRDAALAAYGGRCACCGESEPWFLTIDHVNDDGAAHRKAIGNSAIYRWLAKHGYPDGYRLLCFNCNLGRARNGGVCPHEEERGEVRHLRAV